MISRRVVVQAIFVYLCICAASTAFYVAKGLKVFSSTPLPSGSEIIGVPLLVLASPFWYVQDALREPSSGQMLVRLSVAGVVVALAITAVVKAAAKRSQRDVNRNL
jgi:hypothetical protein